MDYLVLSDGFIPPLRSGPLAYLLILSSLQYLIRQQNASRTLSRAFLKPRRFCLSASPYLFQPAQPTARPINQQGMLPTCPKRIGGQEGGNGRCIHDAPGIPLRFHLVPVQVIRHILRTCKTWYI